MMKSAAQPCPTCGGHAGFDDPRRKISVKQAAEIASLSEASFRRHFRHLIHQISPNRQAVELGDAYTLPAAKK
jgi:hypothetical protein